MFSVLEPVTGSAHPITLIQRSVRKIVNLFFMIYIVLIIISYLICKHKRSSTAYALLQISGLVHPGWYKPRRHG